MTYQITLTNGTVLATVPDNELDTTTSLALVGKDYLGYGTVLNDNFVRLLESFANTTPPSAPLTGQLWYDTAHHGLKNWNGSAWVLISGAVQSVAGQVGDVTVDQLVTAGLAPLASPTLSGSPTTPTASTGNNSTQIASTAFVNTALSPLSNQVSTAISSSGITLDLTNAGQLTTAMKRYGASHTFRLFALGGTTATVTADDAGLYEIVTGGLTTITLPPLPNGNYLRYRFVNLGTAVVRVQPAGSDTFFPSTSYVIVPASGSVEVSNAVAHWLYFPAPLSDVGNYLAVTSSATLTISNAGTVTIDATAGSVTVTLPAISVATGKAIHYRFVRIDGSSNTVSLTVTGSDTIRPSASSIALIPLGVLELVSDGQSIWNVVQSVQSVLGNSGAISLSQLVAGGVAPVASPSFSGVPRTPTATSGTNTTQIASTEFVAASAAAILAQFSLTHFGAGTFCQKLPGGLIIQGCAAVAPGSGSGPVETAVNLLQPFPNAFVFCMAVWNGNSPPATGNVSARPLSLSQIGITINAPVNVGYGVNYLAVGS